MEILRPIVSSTIIDKSFYTFAQGSYEDVVLGVITADKGRDSKFLELTSPAELLKEFTVDYKPNDKVHGQAILDVLQAMEAGAIGRVIRVVPPNATLPNGLIGLQTAAKAYGLDVVNIETPDEMAVGTGEGVITVTLKNTTPFELKTEVSLYSKTSLQNLADFYNGTKTSTELEEVAFPTSILSSDPLITVPAGGEIDYTFDVTGTLLGILSVDQTFEVGVMLSDESTKLGYVSKEPFIGGIITGKAEPAATTANVAFASKKLLVKPVMISAQGITNKASFEAIVEALPVSGEDIKSVPGYSEIVPLFGFVSKSKNNDIYSVSLNPLTQLDNTYSFRTYELTVSKQNTKGVMEVVENGGAFLVSLDPDALDETGTSLFIKDVLNIYFDELEFYFNESAYETLLTNLEANIASVMGPNSTLNPALVDFFYNTLYNNVSSDPLYKVLSYRTNIISNSEDLALATVGEVKVGDKLFEEGVLVETIKGDKFNVSHFSLENIVEATPVSTPDLAQSTVPLYSYATSTYKYLLGNGSAGTWTNADERIATIVSAYNGGIDPNILNKRLIPVDLLFDSNQHASIRMAIKNFVTTRGDCFSFMGLSVNDAKTYPVKLSAQLANYSYDSNRIALFAQGFNEVNKYTGKRMNVSATYHLAYKIVKNDVNFGTHKAIAGKNYGLIGGKDMDISYVPNPLQEEEMVLNKLNFFVQDRESTRIGTQNTTQLLNSALSDIPTVRALLKLIRKVEIISENFQFETIDAKNLSSLQDAINNSLGDAVLLGAFSAAEAIVYSSDYDKTRKRARVRITLSSVKFLEQIILDWIVN